MGEVALALVVLAMLASGFFLIPKLDKFIEENRNAIENESETAEPSCIMLTEDLTEEEIAAEISRFRTSHGKMRVIIYDSTNDDK